MTSYHKILQAMGTNMEVRDYLPRSQGRQEKYSLWKELELKGGNMEERADYVRYLSKFFARVWLKTATVGGRARLFVKVCDTRMKPEHVLNWYPSMSIFEEAYPDSFITCAAEVVTPMVKPYIEMYRLIALGDTEEVCYSHSIFMTHNGENMPNRTAAAYPRNMVVLPRAPTSSWMKQD